MIHFRSSLLAAALAFAALGLPSTAQADGPLPCVDLTVVSVNCGSGTAPVPEAEAERCPGSDLVPTPPNLGAVRVATTCLVNAERTKRGLKALKPTSSLQSVARAYARRMVRESFFEHTSPDGGTFISRIKRTSYLRGTLRRWSVGENIAWGTGELATPQRIVKAWMESPGHRRNILTASFTELGMGVAAGSPVAGSDGQGATYVNEFGERRR